MDRLTLFQFQAEHPYLPLGALYLAYGLEKEGIQFDLKIYPSYKYYNDLNKLHSFLVKSNRIIAIGCWSDMLPYVLIALEKIKKEFPEKIIILGGIGPTEVAEEILNKFEFIDFILKGCGVYSLPKLFKQMQSGINALGDIDGLVYRGISGVISNHYEGYYLNIPDFPPYHRISNIQQYHKFPIFTSFGCPYHCTFCHSHSTSPQKVIYRDLNKVIEEIKLMKKNRKPFIDIHDESFVINRERVIRFCNLLRAEKLNVAWSCYGRIDMINEELLKVMSRSGCEGMYYGIESGSNEILKKIKKGFTIERAMKILLLSKKYIRGIIASFVYLFPFERPKDFIQTKFFLRYLQLNGISVQLHPLRPVKNSEIDLAYRKDLFLSNKIKSTSHIKLNDMPRECIKLVESNPEIFYFYYFYNFKELNEILRIANDHRITK